MVDAAAAVWMFWKYKKNISILNKLEKKNVNKEGNKAQREATKQDGELVMLVRKNT